MEYEDLTAEEAQRRIAVEPDLVVLDVRTSPEFALHRIEEAVLLPVQELADRLSELDTSRPHLVVCEHGIRSVAACEFLAHNGFSGLANLRGGMARWLGAGLPYQHGTGRADS